ncbi:MAG: glycosyltransferase family 4 protein [Verrucomicrobiota bacterium]
MKLLTITYSDLGLAWGPAVHYLELWNSVAVQDSSVEIEGWCCSWTGKPPLMPPRFQLHTLRLPPFLRARQLWADLNFAGRLLLAKRPTILYVRAASFQVALRAAMLARRFPVLVVEMNGLAVEDEVSAKSSRFILWAKSLSERALLKRCQLAICVSNQIAKSVSTRIGCPTVVIKNGVGRQFKPAGSELGTVRPQDQVTKSSTWGHSLPGMVTLSFLFLARHFPQS